MSLTSPPESGFTPRREFLRDATRSPNAFSLLAVSGANCIRLYSFPLPLLTALRRLFDQRSLVTNLREDIDQQLCEIALAGKPWSSPKSLPAEKLLIEILAVIYTHGFTYLSTIDYGRESDDRLAMAFSRPVTRALSPSPLSPSESPLLPTSVSSAKTDRRIPFALSFTSTTVLRVIAPPLHSTPAILQAVRGSWPRGVVSEKKVADNCFEFKLKGYRWFQEDTFATDSLRHILSLLSSLDAHSFTLLASVTLTGRSRVKDLWIFTGPASSSVDSLPDSPAPSILNGSNADFRRVPGGSQVQMLSPTALQTQHRKLATEPTPAAAFPHSPHARAATESPGSSSSRRDSNVLRKPAPRAQVPVSVHDTDTPMPEPEPLRAHMPSVVPGSVENLTGVGSAGRTPDVFYSTSPLGHHPPHTEEPFPLLLPKDGSRSQTPSSQGSGPHTPPSRGSGYTSPAIASPSQSPLSSPPTGPTPAGEYPDGGITEEPRHKAEEESPVGTPPLLGPTAFRDSTLSSATTSTYDMPIPIKWTGMGRDSLEDPRSKHESVGPNFPGGWQPTPIDEKPEEFEDTTEDPSMLTPEIQEVPQRVASPDSQSPDVELRKSEAGLVGLIAASENQVPGEGKGWVVVDVEGKGAGNDIVASPVSEPHSPTPTPAKPATSPGSGTASPGQQQQPISPAAKAIAIVDAIESKNKSTPPSSLSSKSPETSKSKSKFFSLGRKNSTKAIPPSSQSTLDSTTSVGTSSSAKSGAKAVSEDDTKRAIELVHAASVPKTEASNKKKSAPKPSLRERLRLIGTPEASRNEDKRRSLN